MADQDHEHDIVPVTDAGGDTQYDYCRTCPWRSESYPVPSKTLGEVLDDPNDDRAVWPAEES